MCACTGSVNKAGDTPLSLAYKNRHLETIKYLAQEHQCDPKCVCAAKLTVNFLVSTICLYPQLQWIRLETLLSPLSVPVVTWRWSRLSSTSMLIQIVSVYQCCYVVDGGLPQSQLTRLVTLHSLWPTKVDTGKLSSILPSLITVIRKVNLFSVFRF